MGSLADLPELVGFFSYSREDDEGTFGALSALRERIQYELRAQLGRTAKTFRIWQDKEAIPSGTLWESEIKNSVAQAVFFIPIITPTVVASPYCRFELESFLTREAALGRDDLVFPILYIDVPALDDSARRQNDPALSLIARRQYVDWREFRHLDVSSTELRRAVGRFCVDIRNALHRPWLSPEEKAVALERAKAEQAEAGRRAEEARRAVETEARKREVEAQRQREMVAERKAEAERRRAEERRLREDAAAQRRAAAEKRTAGKDAGRFGVLQPRPFGIPSRGVLIGGSLIGVLVLGAIGGALLKTLQPAPIPPPPLSASSPSGQVATTTVTPPPTSPAPQTQIPQALAPASPASAPSAVTHLGELRFDGTYRDKDTADMYEHFRFYPDGKVVYFWQRLYEPAPTASSSLYGALQSTYETSGADIKFTFPGAEGSIDYSGTIGHNSMNLDGFSHINNNRFEDKLQFIPFP